MSAHIIELQAENIKRLKAIRIVPKGSTVVVSGKNDQGKSSALDSIDFAFRGKDSICDEPLRAGEKRGTIKLKLSDELNGICEIERRFTPSGTVLEVRNRDGVPQKSPQALLDAIISKITFDPLSFTRMKPAEQMETLKTLVGLDFTQLNSDRKRVYEERTVKNRELENAKTRLASFPLDPSAPKEPVSTAQLAEKLGQCQSQNLQNKARRDALAKQKSRTVDLSADIISLKSKITQLEKMLFEAREQMTLKQDEHSKSQIEEQRLQVEMESLKDLDETEVRKQIAEIEQINARIEANRRHEQAKKEVEALEIEVKTLTQGIKDLDEEKAAQIEFAEFPLPNLSFDEERGVLLNGDPFSQGSSARQLQAAVAIGLALNPKIRVILIRDGSLLDDDSMKLVSEMAAQANAQVWIEVVNSKDPSAIVIEDGEIKPL